MITALLFRLMRSEQQTVREMKEAYESLLDAYRASLAVVESQAAQISDLEQKLGAEISNRVWTEFTILGVNNPDFAE